MGLPDPVHDPYLLPNGVLRNLLGIEDRRELQRAEADLVSAQEVTLVEDDLVPHTRDFAELCAIHRHPFREGNGRTQRLFWSRIALDAGWALDWRPIHGTTLDDVSRLAREGGDSGPLQSALDSCVSPRP